MQKTKGLKMVAIILGAVAGVSLLGAGGFFFYQRAASASDVAPRDVAVSEITETSAHVGWTTGGSSQGVVEYGTSPTSLTLFAVEGGATTTHSVNLTLLTAGTTYYFDIKIGDKNYTNGGVPWSFATKSTTGSISGVTPTQAAVATPTSAPRVTVTTALCNETNCENMKTKFGKGCTTQDYFLCLHRQTPTPTP